MVKLCDLPEIARKYMISDISIIMKERYHIDSESINEFWGTVEIGIQVRRKA